LGSLITVDTCEIGVLGGDEKRELTHSAGENGPGGVFVREKGCFKMIGVSSTKKWRYHNLLASIKMLDK